VAEIIDFNDDSPTSEEDVIVWRCDCGNKLWFFHEDWVLECAECGELVDTSQLIDE